jgi:hypothetical protein
MIAAGLLTPVLLLAAGAVLFYVLKDPPPPGPCEEFLSAAQKAAIEDYRRGMDVFGVACTFLLLPLIAWVSVERRRAGGWKAELPSETGWGIAGVIALLFLHLLPTPTFALHAVLAVLVGLVVGGILMVLSAWSTIRFWRGRRASALGWLLLYLWLALLVALPALLVFPIGEGTDFFCINGIV